MKMKEGRKRRGRQATDVQLSEPPGRCARKSAAGDLHQNEKEGIRKIT